MFQKTLEDLSSRMAGAEAIQSGWQNPNDANEATELLKQLEKFGERLLPIQRSIEYANDQASVFASSSVIVSHALLAKLEDLNTRYLPTDEFSFLQRFSFSRIYHANTTRMRLRENLSSCLRGSFVTVDLVVWFYPPYDLQIFIVLIRFLFDKFEGF